MEIRAEDAFVGIQAQRNLYLRMLKSYSIIYTHSRKAIKHAINKIVSGFIGY
jgi:hypothetical protein